MIISSKCISMGTETLRKNKLKSKLIIYNIRNQSIKGIVEEKYKEEVQRKEEQQNKNNNSLFSKITSYCSMFFRKSKVEEDVYKKLN